MERNRLHFSLIEMSRHLSQIIIETGNERYMGQANRAIIVNLEGALKFVLDERGIRIPSHLTIGDVVQQTIRQMPPTSVPDLPPKAGHICTSLNAFYEMLVFDHGSEFVKLATEIINLAAGGGGA